MDKKEISFVSEYNENKELTLTKYLGKNDDIIVVEDGITEIGSFAFYQCTAKEIIIPDSVKFIQQCAFASCNVDKITFGKGLEKCDDDIILNSSVQEIVFTKPIKVTLDKSFLSLLYGLISEENSHIEDNFRNFKIAAETKQPKSTFLLTYHDKSVRLPRHLNNYLNILAISDVLYDCFICDADISYQYHYILNSLSNLQDKLSVCVELYLLENCEDAKNYLKNNAMLIVSDMIESEDDEALSLFIKFRLMSDNTLMHAFEMASEKNMQTSVGYILAQMKERGLRYTKIKLAL